MKTLFRLLSISILGICVFTKSTNAQQKNDPNALLWEISGKGLTKPSYLYGTIHMICTADFILSNNTKKALDAAEQLVLELNFNDTAELKAMEEGMSSAIPLSKKLTARQFEQVDSVLTLKTGVSLKKLDKLTLTSVYSFAISQTLPCKDIKSYEQEFLKLAKATQKPIAALETVKEQFYYFGKSYPDDAMVGQIIAFDQYKEIFNEVILAYKEENLDVLYPLIKNKKFGSTPESNQWMLSARNTNWAKKMPQMMKDKSCFFAVGAGHLAGKDGIIQLLRASGYQVKAILK
ncbi:TraB/GumN family protein [Pedobacter sp. MC2016-24]|uniref:TraB/GumN family protein n=1 Tax=Pedobacter sp. MC2016-24 TaxID=2780090 RepID=UPI00187ECB74|nr:TraB/GumN family protein [Pedobacter sp. MC2016-24]MBE9602932.1 TraB/GumN family protein [Pedobacter sp. MC2016-24]